MKKWRKHRKKKFDQYELAKLSLKVQVMQSIQEYYVEKVEKLSYKEYLRLTLLLCKSHEKFGECTGAEYYKIIDKKSTKFCNKLIII